MSVLSGDTGAGLGYFLTMATASPLNFLSCDLGMLMDGPSFYSLQAGSCRIFDTHFLQFRYGFYFRSYTRGLSMPGATMKLRVSSWGPIFISIGSVMNVVGVPPATEPSNWQNAIGTFSSLSHSPSFSTSPGLTQHLV